MLFRTFALVVLIVSLCQPCWAKKAAPATVKPGAQAGGYAGSQSCRQCHEKFYSLWSTSRHGLAMQPYTAEFAQANLLPQQEDVVIGGSAYRADLAKGAVIETTGGATASYPIAHVLGGKNVYYFLTPLSGGRLQTLPVAYDVQKKAWFDTAASGVRHAPGAGPDQPVHWKDPAYTFNTSCHSCHVSQLNTNYDLKTGTYETTWAEPGINCETCHGPSAEHNAVMLRTPKGKTPSDMKIILVSKFTPEQHNATCSGCHAKAMPITAGYTPGDRFFDHFGLATLEDPDYYPDGRDLGENYTYTSWLMSPCAKAGKLHCVTCHTSSGRYRFKAPEKANEACMPCHQDHVQNAPEHTRHKADGPAGKCVSCHMPMTSFARMNRSDHSMLPPSPAATIAFGSPNACNGCHADKDAAWADAQVRQWRTRDYQAPVLSRGKLVEQARKRDWSELHAMLAYIADPGRDEVFAASLVKLIQSCPDSSVAQALLKAAKDPSPLVRAAAMEALQQFPSDETGRALVAAASDEYRLVRVRAAATLAGYGNLNLDGPQKTTVDKAEKEYLASLLARPDQWSSHYNLGNYMLQRGETEKAIASYDTALHLEPRSVLVMINESMALARIGKQDQAMQLLEKALALAPDNAPANFNMGLLRAERNDRAGAEANLKKALQADPQLAPAAYNLCALLAPDRLQEASTYCKMAADLRPQEPKFAYTLAYIQFKLGNENAAVATLENLVASQPLYPDSYILLGGIYRKQGRTAEAGKLYASALANEAMPEAAKSRIAAQLMGVKQ
ncbi:tetratricopeptide repeat protein [Fundidesulfovibrio agrisoli]|uniref:tetratricopeptide repeat protein n=1 Tax=Fundidesulfovibrio agrisoli TaxID=2922717 RepID=UPI0024354938|nr:tetratricopeptide repeat protein [Fundidesulfovibrio agrisoli]